MLKVGKPAVKAERPLHCHLCYTTAFVRGASWYGRYRMIQCNYIRSEIDTLTPIIRLSTQMNSSFDILFVSKNPLVWLSLRRSEHTISNEYERLQTKLLQNW